MSGAKVTDPGLRRACTIDGTTVGYPAKVSFQNPARQSLTPTATGRNRLDAPYDGPGLPDVLDTFEFTIDWELDDSDTVAFLERLRTAGGVRVFTPWKQFAYRYTASSAQDVFYLPRPDAYSRGYDVATVDDVAIIKVDGVTQTVVYQTSVVSGDTVDAGEAWISNTAVSHPTSGATVALFKLGTPCTAGQIVTVEYHPLFNVSATVQTQSFAMPGREDKSVFFVEVN